MTSLARKCIAVLVVVLVSSTATAQIILNPTGAEFNPSPDHDSSLPDGTPIVTSYRLDLFLSGASEPFQTVDLGKPAPDADGVIRVNLSSVFVGWPVAGTVYTAAVAAVGPGGTTSSALSNTFGFSTGSCSFAVAPISQSFGASGGSASVSITAPVGCGWTATATSSWISITSGTSGSGNGTTVFSVTSNSSTASRTGTMTIAGQTVTITEGGSCSVQLSPTSQSFGASGGTASVSITAPGGCTWTATDNSSWISITSGTSGSGNGTTAYSVTANGSTASRTGTITIAGQTVTITESGTCSLQVSPTSQSLAATGGSGTITVTGGAGCAWTATSNASWITVTSGSSGSGNGTARYTVAANSNSSSRTGSLTVAGRTVTVTEAASSLPAAPTNVRIKG